MKTIVIFLSMILILAAGTGGVDAEAASVSTIVFYVG